MTNEQLKLLSLATLLMVIFFLSCGRLAVVHTSYTHYRLPVSLQPDRYQLRIITRLDNPENFTFEGQVSIRFQVLEDTNNITLHARNLTIDESRIKLKSYEDDDFQLCLDGVETVPEQDYYIIRLCQSLRKGHMYKVKLEFSGILNREQRGYFRTSYVDEVTNKTRWLTATQFEPTEARYAFPCFDEPNYKARFVIWLGHHKSLTALSNMPREKQIPLDDLEDYVWSIFEESVPMSTYLVAYTVNDLICKESQIEEGDVVFRTWCRREYMDQCIYASELAPKILQYYAEMFGIPFPLKKMDQIGIPDFGHSAMENWGLIVYDEMLLFNEPNNSSAAQNKIVTGAIAHEMAHQWFGNLVTMKWWTDLWLNEGFATYVATLAVEQLKPEFEMYQTDSITNSFAVFKNDDKLSSSAVSRPILKDQEIHEKDDAIYYSKGANILRMMHSFLGHEEFFAGVRAYLIKHKYKNAEQDDLWAAFTEITHEHNGIQPQHDMKTIMDSWTLQPGYPVVRVNRNYKTGSIEISQKRYFENSTVAGEETHKCWWIPLSYTTATELDFMTMTPKTWLECDDSGKSINLKLDKVANENEWLIFNIQLSGIYRVMYDTDNWRLIQETLNSDRFTDIHVMNRAQIMEDVLSFVWSDYLGYDTFFDFLEYLSREREYLPWNTASNHISRLFMLFAKFPQHQSYFKAYMRSIVEPVYFDVGGLNATIRNSTTHSQIELQNDVTTFACAVELEDCVQTANDFFRQWKLMKNPDEQNPIPVDLRDNIYTTVMRHGDKDNWDFLWQRYKASKLPNEKIMITYALGCSHNAEVLKNFLDVIFDKDEHARHPPLLPALRAIKSSRVGFSTALEYYIEHISQLYEADFRVANLLESLSYEIATTEDRNKLVSLIESNRKYFKEANETIARVEENMNLKLQWFNRNLADILTQIKRHLSLKGITVDTAIE